MFRSPISLSALGAILTTAAWSFPAQAQSQQVGLQPDSGLEEIIVTGRAGNSDQKKVETSYAISTISEEELQMRAPLGVGEALKNVPGFWIENTGGEGSGNLRVRGIPNDGYSTVGLLEDGITMQSDAGLGWLNADQSLRVDQTVQRIEVVRGGPSSIFYSNAPGAVINFISRRGGDTLEGLARYEMTDYDSNRVDAWLGGPIGGSDWRFFAGGYYRLSDGQRQTGYRQDEGGQFRLNLSRDFELGSVMFGVKRIDERIGNAAGGIFMNDAGGDPVGVPGFDVRSDAIAGPESRRFDFLTRNGVYDFDNATGTTVELTQLTLDADFKLSDNITLEHKMRHRDSFTHRTSITPFEVRSAADFLNSTYGATVNAAAGERLGLVYRDSGATFDLANQNGNGLALTNLARSYVVPLDEFITDTRILGSFEALGSHDVALGFYYANADELYDTNSASVLTDVKNNASVLDAYRFDSAGNRIFQYSNGGITSYGVEFNNAEGQSDTLAVYASDEWQITDKIRVDGGVRWEQIDITGQVEGRTRANLGQSPTAADDAVTVGNGVFAPFSRQYDDVAWTLGTNYQFQPDFGTFLRYTETFRLPNISSFLSNANAQVITQTMNFLEGGVKLSRENFDVYLTAFRTIYESYAINDFRPSSTGALVQTTVYGDTETTGLELEAGWRPVEWFDLHAMWTYQDARFTDFLFTNNAGQQVDYSDNRLIRVPENSFRITPGFNLLERRLRLQADVGYYGQRYGDVANQINLPSYWVVDFNARFDATDQLQLNLIVNNVTDEIGLANGNPRAGAVENSEVGDRVYIGSAIFGRSIRAAATYRF